MLMLVAVVREEVLGFLAIHVHNEWAGEIHIMAIQPASRRKGIGRALQARAEDNLRKRGCEFMTVKTLSPSRECEEYMRTREFYLAMGFRPLEEFKTLWGEANPCLFMAKKL